VALLAVIAPANAGAVLGGKTIRASRYPALVQITARMIPKGRGTLCGGGLITPRIVITAAHCLGTNPNTERHIEPFKVVSGRQRAYTFSDPAGGITFGVDKTARAPANPNLRESFPDDLALLHLVKPAPFAPFKLAAPAAARPGARVQVVGWGDTTNGNQSGRNGIQLHGLTMRVRSNPLCKRLSPRSGGYDAPSQLCLTPQRGAGPQGTCEGDSGTALLSADGRSVIGVVSHGGVACGRGASIFARVSSGPLRRWVDKQIAAWSRQGRRFTERPAARLGYSGAGRSG
jgi:secreted trypsin-like serine protease